MVKRLYEKVKSVIFADPKLLYKEEIAFTNKPFYFAGVNNRAVLLVHGWTSTSYEVRRLGRYLNESGYTVSAPMLRGHGTVPKSLEDVSFLDWLSDLEGECQALKKEHTQVYIAGTSIGANAREAQNAESRADFIHKFKISAKEVEETEYWLLLCKHSDKLPDSTQLLIDLEPIKKIITKIISTSKLNK